MSIKSGEQWMKKGNFLHEKTQFVTKNTYAKVYLQ